MENNEKKLYPFKFLEDSSQTAWGTISYHIADLGSVDSMIAEGWFGGNSLSELMGTYLERVVGDDSFEYYGLQFPILVKVIKTTGWQPLQVNVPDEIAEERYDSLGKTSLWYIQEASPEATMYLGLKRDVDAGDFYRRSQEGSLKDILNETHPKVGDMIPIRPGTVFAAGPGLTIVEIGECSELTLGIHNWGIELPDGDDLLLEEAFDLIDFKRFSPAPPSGDDGFKVTRMELVNPLHIFSEQPGDFAIYHCVSGEAVIQPGPGADAFSPVDIKAGHTILVPSEGNDFLLLPTREDTVLLEAVTQKRNVPDSYTGSSDQPDAPDPHVRIWN